ncbi:iron transporter [Methylobacterium sp. J-067]|nr:iron transporter [Methylobacterium sp. J-067]
MAALATALGAVTLPLSRAEAVSTTMLASFAVMAGAVVFVFAAATLSRAAIGILGTVAILTACLWLAGGFSAGVPA